MYFQKSYFEVVGRENLPAKMIARCRAWDRAASKPSPAYPDPDWTAGALWSRSTEGVYFIEHIERFRDSSFGVETKIHNIATSDGKKVPIFLWQDPGGDGKAAIEHWRARVLNGFVTTKEVAKENKEEYAQAWSSQAEAGNVKIVKGAWNDPFTSEAEAFPRPSAKKDQIDACSGAYIATTDSDLAFLRGMVGD